MSSFAVWRFFRQSIQWRVLLPLRLSGEESAALALGFGGAVGLVRGLRSRLVGVEPFDPVLWTTAATALIGIVVIASLIPAWRAARLSIAATLRS